MLSKPIPPSYPHLCALRFSFLIHDCAMLATHTPTPTHAVCMPNPGSIPAAFNAFAFLVSTSRFSAFCAAASALTSSTSANLAPRGASSRSKSTVAHMVTFSPRIVMTPGSLTSWISQRGTEGADEGSASGFRAAMRSWHSVRTRLAGSGG